MDANNQPGQEQLNVPQKIGVFSGSFDPVHRGHIESAIVALGALNLDTVLILLEKKPRRKTGLAEIEDRANMLELATMDYPSLRVVDLEDDNVTTTNTLDYLSKHFPDGEYWFIVGSDMLGHIEDWPDSQKLMKSFHICVVLRENQELKPVKDHIASLKETYPNTQFIILPSVWSPVSSSQIKKVLKSSPIVPGLDPAVHEYIKKHELYT